MKEATLTLLRDISEQLAEWSLRGCLVPGNITNHEQKQLDRLELRIEEAIIEAEEQIIDGVLCHQVIPDGEWEPYTLEAMTIALTAERAQNEKHRRAWIAADEKLQAIRNILKVAR